MEPAIQAARSSGWTRRRRRIGPSRCSRSWRIRALRRSSYSPMGAGRRLIRSPQGDPLGDGRPDIVAGSGGRRSSPAPRSRVEGRLPASARRSPASHELRRSSKYAIRMPRATKRSPKAIADRGCLRALGPVHVERKTDDDELGRFGTGQLLDLRARSTSRGCDGRMAARAKAIPVSVSPTATPMRRAAVIEADERAQGAADALEEGADVGILAGDPDFDAPVVSGTELTQPGPKPLRSGCRDRPGAASASYDGKSPDAVESPRPGSMAGASRTRSRSTATMSASPSSPRLADGHLGSPTPGARAPDGRYGGVDRGKPSLGQRDDLGAVDGKADRRRACR